MSDSNVLEFKSKKIKTESALGENAVERVLSFENKRIEKTKLILKKVKL